MNNFVIIYGRRQKTAKLHKAVGGCYWANLEHLNGVAVDSVSPADYDSRCKFCWPRAGCKAGVVRENCTAVEEDESMNSSESDTEDSA